ncbi:MAG: CBS domain-containing protein [Pseudobdellovibrionaceae bacterium]
MRVKDVMHSKAQVINFTHTVDEAAKLMKKEDCGSIPVEKNDKMVGMITDRDIAIRVVALGKDPHKTKVEDVMSEGINYCFEDEDLHEVSEKMIHRQHRRLPVVDRNKRLVGMISLGDIASKGNDASLTHEILSQVSHH